MIGFCVVTCSMQINSDSRRKLFCAFDRVTTGDGDPAEVVDVLNSPMMSGMTRQTTNQMPSRRVLALLCYTCSESMSGLGKLINVHALSR